MQQGVPPQAIEIEENLLCSCLVGGDEYVYEIIDEVKPEYFYRTAHQKIFNIIVEFVFKNNPLDLASVADALYEKGQLEEVGGAGYLARLIDVGISIDPAYHCKKIKEKFLLRSMIESSYATIKRCHDNETEFDDTVDFFCSQAARVSDGAAGKKNVIAMPEACLEQSNLFERRFETKKAITGIPTGIHKLDKCLAGFQDTNLIILAARPGMGKTAFALSVMRNAANFGYGSLMFSLEMSYSQLIDRMVASDTGIDGHNLRTGFFNKDQHEQIKKSLDELYNLPIHIDDRGSLTVHEMIRTARRYIMRHPEINLLIFDHLQLVRGVTGQNRNDAIGEVTHSLKTFAKEVKMPVLVLSQLNRNLEGRTDKRPILSDLRESGNIEQDADDILFLYRPVQYSEDRETDSDCEILVGKQRQGPIGFVKCLFHANTQRFLNLVEDRNYDTESFVQSMQKT